MPSQSNSVFFSPGFMDAVRSNNMDDIRRASIAGLKLQDFEEAFLILDDSNSDWRMRPITDITRAVITGLGNQIKRMKEQSSSPTPSIT